MYRYRRRSNLYSRFLDLGGNCNSHIQQRIRLGYNRIGLYIRLRGNDSNLYNKLGDNRIYLYIRLEGIRISLYINLGGNYYSLYINQWEVYKVIILDNYKHISLLDPRYALIILTFTTMLDLIGMRL